MGLFWGYVLLGIFFYCLVNFYFCLINSLYSIYFRKLSLIVFYFNKRERDFFFLFFGRIGFFFVRFFFVFSVVYIVLLLFSFLFVFFLNYEVLKIEYMFFYITEFVFGVRLVFNKCLMLWIYRVSELLFGNLGREDIGLSRGWGWRWMGGDLIGLGGLFLGRFLSFLVRDFCRSSLMLVEFFEGRR